MQRDPRPSPPQTCDLIVRNGLIITMRADRLIYSCGAVAVEGSRIVMVGEDAEVALAWRAERVIDACGAPVHPGLIDSHFHVPNQLSRGVLPEAASSAEYFAHYARWYDAMDAEFEHAAAAAAAVEMLHAGVTCFVEPGTVFETDAAAEAIAAVGCRASLADPFLWDAGHNDALSHMRRVPPDSRRCEDLLGRELRRNSDPDALIRGHVALFGSGTASDELTLAAVRLAETSGVAFTQHQNTRPSEVAGQRKLYAGRAPLLHLAEIGALAPHCALTHMNILEPDEYSAVIAAGPSVNWCAAGSMNWGFGATGGVRKHAQLFLDGVNVAIGSDVPRWGQDTSPLITFLLARDLAAGPLHAEHIFEMATIGGARAAGLEHEIGSLEPGKRADIVIRSASPIEYQPGYYPIQNILMTSRSRSIGTVIVNGSIVIENGRATRVDEDSIARAAGRHARRLALKSGVGPTEQWPVR